MFFSRWVAGVGSQILTAVAVGCVHACWNETLVLQLCRPNRKEHDLSDHENITWGATIVVAADDFGIL
jgi:hypothetical protein